MSLLYVKQGCSLLTRSGMPYRDCCVQCAAQATDRPPSDHLHADGPPPGQLGEERERPVTARDFTGRANDPEDVSGFRRHFKIGVPSRLTSPWARRLRSPYGLHPPSAPRPRPSPRLVACDSSIKPSPPRH